jgi:hypothetical protein
MQTGPVPTLQSISPSQQWLTLKAASCLADTDGMPRSLLLTLVMALACLGAAVGTFFAADTSGPNLRILARAGSLAGAHSGARVGASAGRLAGYRAGYGAGFQHTYAHAYGVAYRLGLER